MKHNTPEPIGTPEQKKLRRFSGTLSEYKALHYWVGQQLGKPSLCRHCGTTSAKRFEWANISGKYLKDVEDWVRLCKKCHCKMDGESLLTRTYKERTRCTHGHEYTEENTRIYRGYRRCVACMKIYGKQLAEREFNARRLAGKELRRKTV